MPPGNETDLLIRAKKFDLPALEMIYNTFSPGIYRYAMRLLGDSHTAEDCVAETFSRFLKGLRMEQGPDDHVQAYLYRIAHNWITDHYRRAPILEMDLEKMDLADPNTIAEDHLDRHLEREKIRQALQSLTPEQRQVTILHYLEGWDYDEVATAMQKTSGTIRALQFRAIQVLRNLLQTEESHENE
jgi:RNA polymerase sigma-70 factor (ECF subfamily)